MPRHKRATCPKCGSDQTKVVMIKDAIDLRFDIVRRRYCSTCEHRWYTAQKLETVVRSVKWTDNGQLVLSVKP